MHDSVVSSFFSFRRVLPEIYSPFAIESQIFYMPDYIIPEAYCVRCRLRKEFRGWLDVAVGIDGNFHVVWTMNS